MTMLHTDTFTFATSGAENRDFLSGGQVKGMSEIQANTCADCGYTELYAVDPETVWNEWRKREPGHKPRKVR